MAPRSPTSPSASTTLRVRGAIPPSMGTARRACPPSEPPGSASAAMSPRPKADRPSRWTTATFRRPTGFRPRARAGGIRSGTSTGESAPILKSKTGSRVSQIHYARRGVVTPEMEYVAIRENSRLQRSRELLEMTAEGPRNSLWRQHPGQGWGASIPGRSRLNLCAARWRGAARSSRAT